MIDKLKYSLYIIFHPFKGFWELKHEKKGDVWSATILLFIMCLVSILKYTLTGYIININALQDFNILLQIGIIIVPFGLWCISNWCTTTLMDGEGSLKDIYIMTAYALIPLIIFYVPLIIFSNIISIEETSFYSFFTNLAIILTAFMLFIGTMTIHQYSILKTILTIILVLLGMAILIFLGLLFVALIQQVISFVELVYKELILRV
jgi:hypothetical protein